MTPTTHDELTEAARKEALRFIGSRFAAFKREALADHSKTDREWIEKELGQRHISVAATPQARAVATLMLPATCNFALGIWIATVETSYRRGAIRYHRNLVRLDGHDDLFNQFLPALRDHYLKHRMSHDSANVDGAAYYMQAVVGDTKLVTVKRLLERAKEIS